MKMKLTNLTLSLLLSCSIITRAGDFSADSSAVALAKEEELNRRTLERRAVEAVIWGMPAVNYDMMFQAMVRDTKAGPGSNKVIYWSGAPNEKKKTKGDRT